MLSANWLEKRRPHWRRLEQLVDRVSRAGVSDLPHHELQELGILYRQTAADLSVVREDPTSARMSQHLNQLLGRAHNVIYTGRRADPRGIVHFYKEVYPQIFRDTFPYTLAAFILFLSGALIGTLVSVQDPAFVRYIVGPQMVETIERRQMWTHSILTIRPVASSAILTNNLAVSFATFALGITAGIGTVYMLVLNGLLLGVIGAACWQAGMSLQLWSFVAAHGVLELPAIFIAGGAGLLVGRGLLFPGWLSRRESLVQKGAQAVRLLLGVIPLLIIAGFVEGFLSPSNLPAPAKFLSAVALGALLFLYLVPRKSAEGPVS